ncbi:hypothetical protein BHYA_0930g00020 [Botrytis hyacinthi]|uniref:Uncharacterized protein n=1 Tax=Botrytis hyacinthi TaxID=278943 RepID=A0A4Z1G8N8_9HELO|nr:hypothetical protein BHYA_0930g00020 [Botrytis hyacinthi]
MAYPIAVKHEQPINFVSALVFTIILRLDTTVAAKGLSRAEKLKGIPITMARVEAVLRIVPYALMEMSAVVREATDDQVTTIDIIIYMTLILGGQRSDEAIGDWWQGLASAVS